MSEDGWRLLVLHPRRVLLYANLVAATGCFALVAYWVLFGYLGAALGWIIQLLAVGGFLSLVVFVGSYLERR